MWYSINKCNNTITVNQTSDLPVIISLCIKTPCEDQEYKEIFSDISVSQSYSFDLPSKDSIYKLTISNSTDTVDILIPYYDELLQSLISDIDLLLCGCGCESCNECIDEDDPVVSDTLLKTMFYYTLTNSIYNKYFEAAFKCLDCTLNEANICMLINEKYAGYSDNIILMKKLISIYYLSFYFSEYYTFDCKDELNRIFEYDKIRKCISNLGIDIDCIINNIEEVINQNKVWYWQLDDVADTITSNDVTDEFLSNKPYITLQQALNGYIFNYDKIAKIGFCIDNVESNLISITDIVAYSANPAFTYSYDNIKKRIIFLSNEFVSNSNIYLKFNNEQ